MYENVQEKFTKKARALNPALDFVINDRLVQAIYLIN